MPIYTLQNSDRPLLMIAETQGTSGRFFHSFTTARPSGRWSPQATSESNPFAGKAKNGAGWTTDISRADLIRSDYDETFSVNVCNLQLLY
jgi:endo-1,4-beta-xylanase